MICYHFATNPRYFLGSLNCILAVCPDANMIYLNGVPEAAKTSTCGSVPVILSPKATILQIRIYRMRGLRNWLPEWTLVRGPLLLDMSYNMSGIELYLASSCAEAYRTSVGNKQLSVLWMHC